jgi:hypothetical protein
MNKVKKYQKQIITFIVIALLFQYGIFPCLTMANTFANILGAIALLVISIWGILEVKELFKTEDIKNIPPGETELDYIPKSVPKMKVKRKASKKIKQNENI